MSGLVKICGLRQPEHGEAVAAAGADMIGFVFAESRRRVSPAEARAVSERARAVNPGVRTVGLFVDASPEHIAEIQAASGVDLVQLHGMPSRDDIERIGVPAVIVVRDRSDGAAVPMLDYARERAGHELVEMIMIDAHHPTLAGGTGILADWSVAAELARQAPLMLAGGLDPKNVADAVARVRPAAVDVSSGVEREGIKDTELIKSFLANARAAFAANGYSISSGTSSQVAP